MPIDITSVLGAPSAPVSAPAPVSPPAEIPPSTEGGIPEDVLALPEFSGLLEGKPAAVYVDKGFQSPETQVIMQHTKELADAGFGFYTSQDGKTNVIFNTQYVSPEEIQKAEADGKLRDLATPFTELKASFDAVTGAAAPPDASAPPAAASVSSPAPAPAPAGVQKKLASARLKNVTPGGPTSGPVPGQGRILNSILKQPV